MKQLLLAMAFLSISFTSISQTVTLQVNQPDPLQINASKTVYTIIKGSRLILGSDLTLSGGTIPYQISWSNTTWINDSVQNTIAVTPSDTTTYTCKVTDGKGCTTEQPFQVNVVPPVVLKVTATQISCFGKQNGAISLNISGGATPYGISWADGSSDTSRTSLGAGTYTIKVTDAMNQEKDTSITLVEPTQITTSITASFCEGESYLFDGKELAQVGSYVDTLTTTDGCDSIITLNLTVNPLPEAPVISQSGNTLTSSATSGNQWWKDGAELSGEIAQTLEISASGIYSVTVKNDKGCSSRSATHNATFTGVDLYEALGIRCNVFPNPNNGLFTVEVETNQSENIQLELVSVDGKTIARKQLSQQAGKQSISCGKENLSKGVYTLRVQSGAKTVNRKLVVN